MDLRIRIEDEADLVAAREAAAAHGVDLQEEMGPPSGDIGLLVEPVSSVLIAAGVVTGVKMVLEWWTVGRGGLVIDLREGAKDVFYRDRDVPHHYVITMPADGGGVTVDVKDQPDVLKQWVSEVISGVLKPLEQIAAAAKEAFGANNVKVEPAAGAHEPRITSAPVETLPGTRGEGGRG